LLGGQVVLKVGDDGPDRNRPCGYRKQGNNCQARN
jgi:hypothetical protein